MKSLTSDDYSLLTVIANQKERFKKPAEMEQYDIKTRLSGFGLEVAKSLVGRGRSSKEARDTAAVITELVQKRNEASRF